MKFEDIHGTDWRFTNPKTKKSICFSYSGLNTTKIDMIKAIQFEKEHLDWIKEIESF